MADTYPDELDALVENIGRDARSLRLLQVEARQDTRTLASWSLVPVRPDNLADLLFVRSRILRAQGALVHLHPAPWRGLSRQYRDLIIGALEIGKYQGWELRGWRSALRTFQVCTSTHYSVLGDLLTLCDHWPESAKFPEAAYLFDLFKLNE